MAYREVSHFFASREEKADITMKTSRALLSVAIFTVCCSGYAQESKPPEPAPQTNSQLLVAKIHQGEFVSCTDPTEESQLKASFPFTAPRFVSPPEANGLWGGKNSFLEMSKGSKEDHYAMGLKDERGKIFMELVSPTTIAEPTKKRIREAIVRQEQVVRLLKSADTETGDDRLKRLSEVVGLLGASQFASTYPDLTAEITKSDAPFLRDLREKLSTSVVGRDRQQIINRLHLDLSAALRVLPATDSLESRVAFIDKFIKERNLEPELKQIMTMRKYLIWSGSSHFKEALATLDEALEIAPHSALAGRIPGFKTAVKAKMENSNREKPDVPKEPAVPPPSPVEHPNK